MQRIRAYRGSEDYIFISYSHKDTERVMEILSYLAGQNVRLWYDGGIDPGEEWDINIASHIDRCSGVIAFISGNFIASTNCRDELSHARNLEKERILIYLEDITLPSDIAMRHHRQHAIHLYKYASGQMDDFFEKLLAAPIVMACRSAEHAGAVTNEPVGTADISKISPATDFHTQYFSVGVNMEYLTRSSLYTASIAICSVNRCVMNNNNIIASGDISELLKRIKKTIDQHMTYLSGKTSNITLSLASSFTNEQYYTIQKKCPALGFSHNFVRPCDAVLLFLLHNTVLFLKKNEKNYLNIAVVNACDDFYDISTYSIHSDGRIITNASSGFHFYIDYHDESAEDGDWSAAKNALQSVISKSKTSIDCICINGDICSSPSFVEYLTKGYDHMLCVSPDAAAIGTAFFPNEEKWKFQ